MIKISLCRDLSREPQTKISTCYSQSPSLHLKGDWLKEAGFDTGTGVTVKILEGCLILIAERDEVQELRKELYQVKQVVKGMKEGIFSVLNEG
ncbi:SymE family type I addiction module toxin [Salmonella enterica]|nr:type I addiction module toxin, SymE family [Salmonella enterica]EKD5487020.1 SymE family type I addiction module toxin [Salmonella enterica subsp. arizonae]EIM8805324.1 SymE family type I addiction module toxin [Salmonella enterica]ELF1550894.1 SymE family type I addiction module toxin [Salmonella enterica]ELF3225755.1 SymE family type I addiction module toxin [Salmonella enterica]